MSESTTNSVESTLAAVRNLMKEIGSESEIEALSLDLGDSLTINEAVSMKAYLGPYLQTEGALMIDATKVSRLDTAGLQLLTALIRHRVSTGKEVSFSGASDYFRDVATLLGMRGVLGSL